MTPWTGCCRAWTRSGRNWRPQPRGRAAVMAVAAKDGRRAWEPFGVTEAGFAAAPERDEIKVVNVAPRGPGRAGWWLLGAAVALAGRGAAAGGGGRGAPCSDGARRQDAAGG